MAAFQRAQVATFLNRLAEPPRRIVALFGPRQTGKTTIVRQGLRKIERPSLYLAVDEPDLPPGLLIPPRYPEATLRRPELRDSEWVVRHWDAARRESERTPRGAVLVFDEIQKIPNWSETVKGLWDATAVPLTKST